MSWNKVMRFVYWAVSVFFFFAASGLVVSLIKPGPTEVQVMNWMQGMMGAMHSSLMGASMSNEMFGYAMQFSAETTVVMILIGISVGIPLKLWRKND